MSEVNLIDLSFQIALVIGLNEVIKKAFLDERHYKFVPLISIGFGVLASVVLFNPSVKDGIVEGLIVGLSAVGLFSTVKNTVK